MTVVVKIKILILLVIIQSIIEIFGDNTWTTLRDCVEKHPFKSIENRFSQIKSLGTEYSAFSGEFPHSTALGWYDENTKEIKWFCGGSLIKDDVILTAAHCVDVPAGKVLVASKIGKTELPTNISEIIRIENIFVHPEYRSDARYHDIALLKLKKPVLLSKNTVPACLWTNSELPKLGELKTCGFGRTSNLNGQMSQTLNKALVNLVNHSTCSKYFPVRQHLSRGLTESHICAMDNTRRTDTCQGDSGGPLEMNLRYSTYIVPYIVGITSFGKAGCTTGIPGVYTKVATYIDWIKSKININTDLIDCAERNIEYRSKSFNYCWDNCMHFQERIQGEFSDEICNGIILTSNYLVASATCLSNMSKAKTVTISNEVHLIDEVIYHPKYNKFYPLMDDLALIRLKSPLIWKSSENYGRSDVYPTCITEEKHKTYIAKDQTNYKRKSIVYVEEKNMSECIEFYKHTPGVLMPELFSCFDTGTHHVPGSCKFPLGTPVNIDTSKKIPRTRGMVTVSHNCGPMFVTNLAKYIYWMDSVIFTSTICSHTSNSSLEEGNKCFTKQGISGTCVKSRDCVNSQGINIVFSFCGNSNLICCPFV